MALILAFPLCKSMFFQCSLSSSISGLVAEYIVAIDVTRVRFPADAFSRVSVSYHALACSNGVGASAKNKCFMAAIAVVDASPL